MCLPIIVPLPVFYLFKAFDCSREACPRTAQRVSRKAANAGGVPLYEADLSVGKPSDFEKTEPPAGGSSKL